VELSLIYACFTSEIMTESSKTQKFYFRSNSVLNGNIFLEKYIFTVREIQTISTEHDMIYKKLSSIKTSFKQMSFIRI
jgi:hypothetical protein